MWNSYFFELQKKYSMRLSLTNPLVVRFDGKGVTKRKTISFMDMTDGEFSNTLDKTAQYFSQRYRCYTIFGSDEISFIFLDPQVVIKDLEPDMNNYSNEVIAMFSQYFFNYFNALYAKDAIFWHGKCFSIPKGKVKSYVKHRARIIENVMLVQFLKDKGIKIEDISLKLQEEKCKSFEDYEELKKIKNGKMYVKGEEINVENFLEKEIESNQETFVTFDLDTKIEF